MEFYPSIFQDHKVLEKWPQVVGKSLRCVKNDCGHLVLMMFHHPDLGSAFHWLKQISLVS